MCWGRGEEAVGRRQGCRFSVAQATLNSRSSFQLLKVLDFMHVPPYLTCNSPTRFTVFKNYLLLVYNNNCVLGILFFKLCVHTFPHGRQKTALDLLELRSQVITDSSRHLFYFSSGVHTRASCTLDIISITYVLNISQYVFLNFVTFINQCQ